MRSADYLLNLTADQLQSVAWVERDQTTNSVKKWTWGNVRSLALFFAEDLLCRGLRARDRVVNLAPNSLEWAILDLACSVLNVIHVPIDHRFSKEQRLRAIEQIEPKWTYDPTENASLTYAMRWLNETSNEESSAIDLSRVLSSARPDDLSTILFTSGTSGKSRGVMLSHRNVLSNALAKLDAMPQRSTDHRLNFLPFAHAYAYTCELKTWLITRSSMETVTGIDSVFKVGEIAQPSLINGVPLFYERLAELWHSTDDSRQGLQAILGKCIRRLASGGATLGHSLRSRFASVGYPIFQGYGLTEASPVVCSNRDAESQDARELTEVGPPVVGIQIRIDSQSRLWVSGDGVMQGYWRDPAATQARIVDGWLDTGDVAEKVAPSDSNSKANLRILGRADDTIVLSNGYKIEPLGIEQCLRTLAGIDQCLLVGQNRPFPILVLRETKLYGEKEHDSDKWLERVVLQLELHPRFALPKKVLLVDEPWSFENGLCNFKGGLLRRNIEARYQRQIDDLYEQMAIPVSSNE